MSHCPCCSGKLLRHIRGTRTYWFCPNCWQEMPDLQETIEASRRAPTTKLILTLNPSTRDESG